MTIGQALRNLGAAVDEIEADRGDVVSIVIEDDERADEGLSATVEVAVRLLEGIELDGVDLTAGDARFDEDGTLTVELGIRVHGDVDWRADQGSVTADGPSTDDDAVDRDERVGETGRRDAIDDPVGPACEATDGEPPHRDPARLREVYDPSRTFAEMTDALGADVTPQTVRRNMIKHGIHDPVTSRGTGESDGDPADESGDSGEDTDDANPALADGIDLPDATSLDDIKDAVRSARTLHEVQTRLGVDRPRARRLLRELGLLDLVSGRLQTGDREVTEEEIDVRIRGAAPTST